MQVIERTKENRAGWLVNLRKRATRFLRLRVAENKDLSLKEKQDLARTVAAQALRLVPADEPLGPELFGEVAIHSYTIAFEGVLLRLRDGITEVFMSRRSDKDPIVPWRRKLHVPGAVLLPGEIGEDESLTKTLARLSEKEFGGLMVGGQEVGHSFTSSARGPVLTFFFLVQCFADPAGLGLGEWYNVDNLPDDVLPYHSRVIIPRSVVAFRAK